MPGSVPENPEKHEPISVLVVDDHPALREGLEGLLREEDGFLLLGALPGTTGIVDAIDELRPDVLILDYALSRGGGLSVCFRVKQLPAAPAVVLYSAYIDPVFAVPATLAQADALVSKTAPVDELLDVLRGVAAGEPSMPSLFPDAMSAVSSRLAADDLPIAGMLFAHVSVAEIAGTLGMRDDEVQARALRMIGGMQASDRVADPVRADLSLR
jgi:DNA-binding NarL/FixJ family response regulator